MPDRPPLESFLNRPPLETFIGADRKTTEQPKPPPWLPTGSNVPPVDRFLAETIRNVPSSAKHFAVSTVQPIIHFVDTATSFAQLGKGVLQKLGVVSGDDAEKYADAVGQFFKDRYGSLDAVKNTLKTDPVGMAADLSMLLSLGGTGLARAPGVAGELGEVVSAAGRAIDPITLAAKGVGIAGTAAGAGARHFIGDYLTHTGDRPIGEAFGAGFASAGASGPAKQTAIDFQSHLRGNADTDEVVAAARRATDAMAAERGRAYKSGMIDIGKDYHILDFADINKAFRDTEEIAQYKGVSLEKLAQASDVTKTRDRMQTIVDAWRGFAPAQYHTPEGFDSLKKALGYVLDDTKRGTAAHKLASKIYNAASETITRQAPNYAKVMTGYNEASNLIKEIESELSLAKKDFGRVKIGTALKKLQSVMRNNVHTNYGNREELAQLLVDHGATNLMQQLAGQALNAWAPRGFGRLVGGAVAAGGIVEVGHELMNGVGLALLQRPEILAGTLMAYGFMSPRLMGEAAYYAGKFYGWSDRLAPYKPGLTSFQAGRVKEIEQQGPGIPQFDALGNLITPAGAMEAPLRNQLPADAIRIERERQRREAEAQ